MTINRAQAYTDALSDMMWKRRIFCNFGRRVNSKLILRLVDPSSDDGGSGCDKQQTKPALLLAITWIGAIIGLVGRSLILESLVVFFWFGGGEATTETQLRSADLIHRLAALPRPLDYFLFVLWLAFTYLLTTMGILYLQTTFKLELRPTQKSCWWWTKQFLILASIAYFVGYLIGAMLGLTMVVEFLFGGSIRHLLPVIITSHVVYYSFHGLFLFWFTIFNHVRNNLSDSLNEAEDVEVMESCLE